MNGFALGILGSVAASAVVGLWVSAVRRPEEYRRLAAGLSALALAVALLSFASGATNRHIIGKIAPLIAKSQWTAADKVIDDWNATMGVICLAGLLVLAYLLGLLVLPILLADRKAKGHQDDLSDGPTG